MLPFNMGAGGSSGVDTGDIGHSLRFRGAQYLNRTFGTPTNQLIWTLASFAKLGKTGVGQVLFAGGTSGTTTTRVEINADGTLSIKSYVSNVIQWLATTPSLYRDPTGHIALLLAFDSTQATQANRLKIYNNGSEVVFNTSGLPSQNYAEKINSAIQHTFGVEAPSYEYFDGYLSRVCFVDGQALTPSSFGYLNTEINEWVSKSQSEVKAVVDAGGTNSTMLDFDDGTSLTTLGYDKSSKGNNWTLNNFSLTAGTSYDWMLDVPGNSFATWNPLNSNAAPTEGNLAFKSGSCDALSTFALPETGKWYFENLQAVSDGLLGFIKEGTALSTGTTFVSHAGAGKYLLEHANATASQLLYWGSTSTSALTNKNTLTTGTSVVCMAYDAATRKVWAGYSVAGSGAITWWNSGDPEAGTGEIGTLPAGTFYVTGACMQSIYYPNIMFGQAPLSASSAYKSSAGGYFACTPPSGFKALCQRNLPTPAILNPSSAVAHRFETGSGIAASIGSDRSGWADWIEWFKRTDTAESWKVRFSDDSSNMLAFDTNSAKAAWSAPSTGTYLGLAFKVGATYGVVTGTYSGDSTSNKNISHSLGKAPTCGIVKNESTGTWYVWNTKMTGAAYFTTLNSATPPAQSNTNTPWGTGNWSSTQFMVTNNATNNLNATGNTYRYILFSDINGFLALLGHTGNASTDGAFEYAGHKAQLQIEKDLAATTGFYVWSDKIDTYNVTASYLLLNTNAGTAAATGIDIVSNAIKHRSATLANASNAHLDISYARVSGKYSLGR